MREILFRGKRVDNGEWVYGGYYKHIDGRVGILSGDISETHSAIMDEVAPATVGQYTGLTDKNGKKIFEGDIIELVNADYETIHVVCKFGTARRMIFENTVDITGFYFELPSGFKSFPIVDNYLGKHDLELFEVIGTIHDKEAKT